AASNDANGVFDFVGSDGTPNTFFSSGGSLARFNGFRYLKYKALLSTTNSSVTPVVNDVTVCFNNSPGGPTPTPTPTPTATPTPTPTITPTPTPTPKQDQTITFPPISTKTYGDADFDPGATASSGLAVTYTTSGQCTIVSNKVHITAAGSCIVTANQSGNGQYNPARPVSQSFSILKAGTTTTSSLLANSPNPTPQFSDTAKLTATVKANTTVTGNGVFSGTVSFTFNGVAVGSAITVSNSSPTAQLSLKLDQTRIPLGAGNYNINATFTPSASSNYGASTSGAHAVAVRHEGQKADYTGDGSARLDYTGTQYALLGSAPTLSAMLRQSLAPDVEPEFVDFSKVNTYVVFKIVPAACGTSCSDTPVWQSANIKINNRADWSTTGIGTAQVTAPTTLGERSYLVLVNVVTNGYILAERAAATLDVFSTTGRFITGGGSVTTDSTSNAGTRRGYFGFDVKGTTTVSGSSIYLYRLRMNVSTSTATNIVTCSTMGNGCTDVDIILRSNAISSLNTGTSLTYPLTGFTAGHAAAQFVNAYSGGHYTQFEFANGFFRLDILDNSSGGSTDKYGFTAYRGNGSIFHQAYIGPIAQTGILAKTNEITIGGGNTTVHPK
ncbi:MAG TPA: Ig-like domain-containing protein, partial [Chthoniobacterales bacterium]|nr:Ig-like domain-containing protein [Chthoniobacterales bacterium]